MIKVVQSEGSSKRLYLDFVDGWRLLDGVSLPGEEVLGEGIKDVNAEAEVAFADGDVHRDDLVLVWLVDLQRRLEDVEEVGELVVLDVLSPVRVKLLPDFVVHVVVVVREALLRKASQVTNCSFSWKIAL